MAYFSRKLDKVELNYKIYNKELLAIIIAIREQDIYLQGLKYKVEVLLNYQNLVYFIITK